MIDPAINGTAGGTGMVNTMAIAEPPVSSASEEAVIRSLYERMMDGWNQGSGGAVR